MPEIIILGNFYFTMGDHKGRPHGRPYRPGMPAETHAKIVGDTTHVLQTHYTQNDSGMIRKAIWDYSRALGKRKSWNWNEVVDVVCS